MSLASLNYVQAHLSEEKKIHFIFLAATQRLCYSIENEKARTIVLES